MTAAMHGRNDTSVAKVAALLVQCGGADVNSKNSKNESALMFAGSRGFPILATVLVVLGADIGHAVLYEGVEAHLGRLSALDWAEKNHHPNVAEILRRAGAV